MTRRAALALFLAVALWAPAAGAGGVRVIDDFEDGLDPGWKEKAFVGHTQYAVVDDDGGKVLRAESDEAASGLFYEIEFDTGQYPVLTWRWKVEDTVPGGDAATKATDDYAARVYVVFDHWWPPSRKSLNYIWANQLPQGEHVPNTYYGNAVMVAVQSGKKNAGRWITERRNLYEDFVTVFGEAPPKGGAIAIMTDTDNTKTSARAWYDDIRLESP